MVVPAPSPQGGSAERIRGGSGSQTPQLLGANNSRSLTPDVAVAAELAQVAAQRTLEVLSLVGENIAGPVADLYE